MDGPVLLPVLYNGIALVATVYPHISTHKKDNGTVHTLPFAEHLIYVQTSNLSRFRRLC